MNAGAYRERITIERCECVSDRLGNRSHVWEKYWSGFAYVNMLSGSEYWAAASVQSEKTVQFVLRYSRMLDCISSTGNRIVFRGDRYNITSVDNVQYRNETLKIRAEKEVRPGG